MTGPRAAPVAPDNEPNPLITLFRQCVVRIDDGAGRFRGTGFLVAPARVVTCGHVVHGAQDLRVRWHDRSAHAAVAIAAPPLDSVDDPGRYPLPDLALLDVEADASDWRHPCAVLEAGPPILGQPPDQLYLAGYTIEHGLDPDLTGATMEFESAVSEDGHSFYKLKRGLVVGGFSGSPLLNLRTLRVAGIVESTRGRHADLGGFAVPTAELVTAFPDLFEDSERHQAHDSRWATAAVAERGLAAERAGQRARLPLRRPVVGLQQGADVSPATLLRPRYAVVGYVGREHLLSDLAAWCETQHSEDELKVWFATGAGGFGKTRLAIQACVEAEARGWTSGLLRHEISDGEVQELAEWPGRLLIAIDYAETRPVIVSRLVQEFMARAPRPPVRIMLLVRHRATRADLMRIFNEQQDEELAALLRKAELSRLDEKAADVDRDRLFEQAAADLGAVLQAPVTAIKSPLLQAPHFGRPLYVLVAALLAHASPAVHVDMLSESALLRELLTEHEALYWGRWDNRRELRMDPEDRRTAVGLATLLTAVDDGEALTVARLIPYHDQEPQPRLIAIARWLAELYPAHTGANQIVIGPLEPDRLGEALVGDVLRQHPDLLAKAIDAASSRQLTHALNIVGRIAQSDHVVRQQLRAVLDERLDDLLLRGFGTNG